MLALFGLGPLGLAGAAIADEAPRPATPGRPAAGLPAFSPDQAPPPLRPAEERSFVDRAQPPLTLSTAIDLALRQHPQVNAAAAAELAAAARIDQARAGWLPQIGASAQLSGSYTYQTGLSPSVRMANGMPVLDANGVPIIDTPVADRSQARYSAQVSVQQLLTDFTRTPARMAQARASARAARGDLDQSKAQIALNAVTSYCAVLQAEALYDSAGLNLAQQRQRLAQAESFLQIGTKPEIDALTARTAVAQADLALLQAQNTVLQNRVQLLVSLGITDPAWLRRPLGDTPLEPLPEESASADALLDQALKGRPDVAALREREAAAVENLRAVRGQYLPQLNLNGAAGLAGNIGGPSTGSVGGQLLTNVPTNGAPTLSLNGALVLSWNAFDGLQTPAQIREAEATLAQTRANLESARQQVRGTLQQALFGVQNARQSLQSAEAVLRQAELQRETAMGRYQAGVGNIIEVGDAQASAASARAQVAQAQFQLAVARAALKFQLGALVPAPRGNEASR